MKPVLATLLSLLLLLAVVMGLGTALFIGFGAWLARWLPLSLVQASGLAIGATIAFAAIIYVLSTISHSHPAYDIDDDFEDNEVDVDPDVFSVDYNLALFARLFGAPASRIEDTLKEFKLLPFRRSLVRTLSKGLKQRVSIGRSLLADPPVLLLDEPTSSLDFETTQDIYRLIHRLHALGKTVLFTSHRPEEIKSLATRILVLHEGAVVFDGAADAYFQSTFYQTLYV